MTWQYAEHYTVVLVSNVFYLHCRSLVPPQTGILGKSISEGI